MTAVEAGAVAFAGFGRSRIARRIAGLVALILTALLVSLAVMTWDVKRIQRQVDGADARFRMLEAAAQAQRHFGDLRYWLTDLSVSLLMLSERRAATALEALEVDLEAIARFAPAAAASIGEDAAAYHAVALEAADAYTEDNRVIGNTRLAAARAHSAEIDAALDALVGRLEAEADAARLLAAEVADGAARRAAAAALAITLGGALLAWWALRSILSPLTRLDQAMRALRDGAPFDPPPEGDDEFGRMSHTLRLLRESQEELRRLEAAAERHRETILTAMETIPDGFALFDPQDRLVLVNRRYLALFPELRGFAEPGRSFEAISRRLAERGGLQAAGAASAAEPPEPPPRPGADGGAVEQRRPDGAWIRLSMRRTPAGGTVAVYTDITDLKRRQVELEAARRGAEAANEAKSRFLASMSHELRTPLNAIIGYGEMLIEDARDRGDDGAAEDLEKITGSGRHLLALINDVLDLSKIEAGRMELFVERFPLAPLIRDVEATVAPLIAKNANRLIVSIDGDPGELATDKTKLRQNLFNLLSNAAKFTQGGEIRLEAAREPEKDRIRFTVIDQGVGMTEEQRSRLFRPFEQAEASTAARFGGTGLGLTITRHFTTLMGGEVSVESEPGRGSTFRFWIPAEAPAAQSAAPERREADASPDRVLVIDDDPAARAAVAAAAREAGFAVDEAAGGEAGVAQARARAPAAIVLDIIMPGHDGWSVLRRLKSDPALAPIPVILSTVVSDREMGLAFGASDHLVKPVDADRLAAALKALARPGDRDVLVVDDDPASRHLFRRILVREGWRVREARDGEEALAALEAGLPALVLLDLIMPRMDGFAFLEAMRARPEAADLPTIVVTSKDLGAEERDWLEARAREVVAKGRRGRIDLIAALKRHAARRTDA
jgi:signal transduction histidine kinase/CheY-like chemotaxis protein